MFFIFEPYLPILPHPEIDQVEFRIHPESFKMGAKIGPKKPLGAALGGPRSLLEGSWGVLGGFSGFLLKGANSLAPFLTPKALLDPPKLEPKLTKSVSRAIQKVIIFLIILWIGFWSDLVPIWLPTPSKNLPKMEPSWHQNRCKLRY